MVNNRALCVFLLLATLGCSGRDLRNEEAEAGRIQRKETVWVGKQQWVEVISFKKDTNDPLKIQYYRYAVPREILCGEKIFFYKNGIVNRVDFYIYEKDNKVRTGRIIYETKDFKPVRYEYYSIQDLSDRRMSLAGIEVYSYSESDGVDSRRIIEYAYDGFSGSRMQVSQYVIKYEDDRPVSMRSSLLDRSSSNIITREEDNVRVIDAMIKNIEKSLLERTQGIRFLKGDCQ